MAAVALPSESQPPPLLDEENGRKRSRNVSQPEADVVGSAAVERASRDGAAPDAASSPKQGKQPRTGGAAGYAVCDVWLVRHGERLDEANEQRWLKMCTEADWHDPPMTSNGRAQAKRRAKSLVDLAKERRFDAIYTSPLLRCVQTSEQLAKVLKLPVRAVPGLGECAGAVRQAGMTRASFRPDTELRRHCGSSSFSVDPALLCFQEQLEQLAAAQGPNLLVVTHREGMRDVSDLTATPFRYSPYCCLAHYRYHLQTGQWEVIRAPELELH